MMMKPDDGLTRTYNFPIHRGRACLCLPTGKVQPALLCRDLGSTTQAPGWMVQWETMLPDVLIRMRQLKL